MSRLAKIDIRIDTLEPVVISQKNNTTVLTNSADYISGSILRGMLAGMYIRKFGGGDRVHEDAAFQRLFLSSNVRFVDANPLAGGQRSFALPFSLMKEKVNGDVQDILFAKDSQKGYKGIKGYGIVSDGKICMAHVGKSVSLHMSRNLENERISGKSEEGHIFNYESIDAGQSFAGEIIGSKEALQEMSEKLFSEKECFVYIGRSKYSQYGRCRLSASGVFFFTHRAGAVGLLPWPCGRSGHYVKSGHGKNTRNIRLLGLRSALLPVARAVSFLRGVEHTPARGRAAGLSGERLPRKILRVPAKQPADA